MNYFFNGLINSITHFNNLLIPFKVNINLDLSHLKQIDWKAWSIRNNFLADAFTLIKDSFSERDHGAMITRVSAPKGTRKELCGFDTVKSYTI